jgi:hypothetical protein
MSFKMPNLNKEFRSLKLDRATQRELNSFRKELIKVPTGIWGLLGIGLIGLIAYLALSGKNLAEPPVPLIDPAADFIGDFIPEPIEEFGQDILEDVPIGSSANKDAAYVSSYAADALASEVGQRLSVA